MNLDSLSFSYHLLAMGYMISSSATSLVVFCSFHLCFVRHTYFSLFFRACPRSCRTRQLVGTLLVFTACRL